MPSYRDNGDGTVSDLVTGLMWTKNIDLNGDGQIDRSDKLSFADAMSRAVQVKTGGYSDWRLPTIKELYSLINFNGTDPRLDGGPQGDAIRINNFVRLVRDAP